MCGSTTALRGNTAAQGHQPNRVPGTLFALHSEHVFPNGVRSTLSVTIRVNIICPLSQNGKTGAMKALKPTRVVGYAVSTWICV